MGKVISAASNIFRMEMNEDVHLIKDVRSSLTRVTNVSSSMRGTRSTNSLRMIRLRRSNSKSCPKVRVLRHSRLSRVMK